MRGQDREGRGRPGGAEMSALRLLAMVALVAAVALPALGLEPFGLRGPTPLDETTAAPPIANDVNNDRRMKRNYPEQPPVIPHAIRGYEISLNANRCLTCHGLQFTEQS